jgi:hypothetical protein
MKIRNTRRVLAVGARALGLLGLMVAVPATAEAVPAPMSCSAYGCDGHDPNIQTWQTGPTTVADAFISSPISVDVALRYGVTDGDQYSWAKVTMYESGGMVDVWTDRSFDGGATWTSGLGEVTKEVGPDGSIYTPMYYNTSGTKMRACARAELGSPWGSITCTLWF